MAKNANKSIAIHALLYVLAVINCITVFAYMYSKDILMKEFIRVKEPSLGFGELYGPASYFEPKLDLLVKALSVFMVLMSVCCCLSKRHVR